MAVGIPLIFPLPQIPRPVSSTLRLVYVGRFDNKQKRVDRLLTACAELPRGHTWSLQLIGDGADKQELRRMAAQLGIEDNCTWFGWHSDPWSQIAEGSVLCFPSDYEGFGAVIIESMARGLPVLATDCDYGPRSLIVSGRNGWLTARTQEAFTDGLLQIAAHPDLIPDARSVSRTVDEFSLERVADRFLAVCQKVVH